MRDLKWTVIGMGVWGILSTLAYIYFVSLGGEDPARVTGIIRDVSLYGGLAITFISLAQERVTGKTLRWTACLGYVIATFSLLFVEPPVGPSWLAFVGVLGVIWVAGICVPPPDSRSLPWKRFRIFSATMSLWAAVVGSGVPIFYLSRGAGYADEVEFSAVLAGSALCFLVAWFFAVWGTVSLTIANMGKTVAAMKEGVGDLSRNCDTLQLQFDKYV